MNRRRLHPSRGVSPVVAAAAVALGAALLVPSLPRGGEAPTPATPAACPPTAVSG